MNKVNRNRAMRDLEKQRQRMQAAVTLT